MVTVYIPEYVVGHWWEQLLHNQSALRLKGRLLFTPGVMVTRVPWQLRSSERARAPTERRARRGAPRRPAPTCGGRGRASTRPPTTARPRRDHAPTARRDDRRRRPTVELEVGPVAHGGHCVARHDGRVVFVRHALPGERVGRRITDGGEGDRFLRADAVEVLRAVAGPGRAALPVRRPGRLRRLRLAARRRSPAQRRLKAAVVAEQLQRLGRASTSWRRRGRRVGRAGPERDATGSAGAPGCSTRSTPDGRPGLRRHRSHDVVPRRRLPDRASATSDAAA